MRQRTASFIKRHYFVIIFLIFYAATLSYKLIRAQTPFYDWDESLYIETGKEMFERKFFLFPLWQGHVWLDKPPLVPLLYGVVMKAFFFTSPEISTRLFTLSVSLVVLSLSYALYFKVLRDTFIATLIVILTAFTPIFLQRAQVVNLDVFLLLGWMGYILLFDRFWTSAFFLMIAVLSKSLLGFYPIAIIALFHLYLLWKKRISCMQGKKIMLKLAAHAAIALIWFILMLLLYKQAFFKQHIIESHFKRVTSSIESHFGKRTYYIELIASEFGGFIWFSFIGVAWVVFQMRKKKFDDLGLLYSVYLLPWFAVLNLTKTKIFWYIYPVIPQFAFLSLVPLAFLSKRKFMYYVLGGCVLLYIGYTIFIKTNYLKKQYATYEPYYYLARYAQDTCEKLFVIENAESRQAFETLSKLNLLITTSSWWGSHPSIVYYFGKKVDFIYKETEFDKIIRSFKATDCLVLEDRNFEAKLLLSKIGGLNFMLIRQFGKFWIFKTT